VRLRFLAGIAVLTAACGTVDHASTTPTLAPSAASATSPSATPSPASPPGKDYLPPTPYPASAGPYVIDLTWVGDSMGWALAAVPCAGQLCPAVAATTDGGVTWQPLPSPPVSLYAIAAAQGDCEQGDNCVSHIRFATSKIGYLFGPGLFMTVDGGESWHEVTSLPVETLEAAGGDVFRVVYDGEGCPGPCNRTVEKATVGSNPWQTLLQIPGSLQIPEAALDTATLILEGSQTIYLPIYGNPAGGEPFTTLFRSLDGGQTWQELADPCVSKTVLGDSAIDFAAAPGGYLAALCFANGDPGAPAVLTSGTSGSSWGARLPVPVSSAGLIAAPSSGTLVVGPATTSGGGPYTSSLSVSTDGGLDWATATTDQVNLSAAPLGASLYLGFEDAMTGRWVGDDQTILTTTDGGTNWTARPFVIG